MNFYKTVNTLYAKYHGNESATAALNEMAEALTIFCVEQVDLIKKQQKVNRLENLVNE